MIETKRLVPWEEARGRLLSITEDGHCMVFDFGKFRVILGGSTKAGSLRGQLGEDLVGKRISILRTDLPDEPILVREIGLTAAVGVCSRSGY